MRIMLERQQSVRRKMMVEQTGAKKKEDNVKEYRSQQDEG
jgi:hypothetical protein